MGSADEKGLNGAGLSTLWSKISSLFIRKTEAETVIDTILENAGVITSEPSDETQTDDGSPASLYVLQGEQLTSEPASTIEGDEPIVPISMYVSGTKLIVVSNNNS